MGQKGLKLAFFLPKIALCGFFPKHPLGGGTNQSAPLVQLQYAIKWISWKIRYHPQHQHQNQHKQSFKSNAVPYPYFALDLIFTKSTIRKVCEGSIEASDLVGFVGLFCR